MNEMHRNVKKSKEQTKPQRAKPQTNDSYRYNGENIHIVDGRSHGQGKCYFENGESYEGQWANGNKHGKGVYYCANGKRHEGMYRNGKREGPGTVFFPDGTSYKGTWKNDKQDKRQGGTLYDSEGCTLVLINAKGSKNFPSPTQALAERQIPELRGHWMPNVSSPDCVNCGNIFTWLRLKHHCRKCGALICHKCSGVEDLCSTLANCRVCSSENKPQCEARRGEYDESEVPTETVTVEMLTGKVGIGFKAAEPTARTSSAYHLVFVRFTNEYGVKKQAAGRLHEGMVLTTVNGVDQRGISYDEVVAALQARPIVCTFAHRRGAEPTKGTQALKAVEYEELGALATEKVRSPVDFSLDALGIEQVREAVGLAEEKSLKGVAMIMRRATEEAENKFAKKMEAAEMKARKELEEEMKEAEGKAAEIHAQEIDHARICAQETAWMQTRFRRKLTCAAAAFAQAAARTAVNAAEAAELSLRVAPEWDADGGFPLNDPAREYCVARWKEGSSSKTNAKEGRGSGNRMLIRVDFEVLRKATDGFNVKTHLLGKGGCCKVYRARIYGHVCAVKVFNEAEGQEEWEDRQIQAEIQMLCTVRHPHINRLFAVSFNGAQRCLLLEYMTGGALDDRLQVDKQANAGGRPPLRWEEKIRVLLHVARGLVHLHSLNPPIIHRY
jgi:hypothetical protein